MFCTSVVTDRIVDSGVIARLSKLAALSRHGPTKNSIRPEAISDIAKDLGCIVRYVGRLFPVSSSTWANSLPFSAEV